MKTVGRVLSEARERSGVTLRAIEERTKVREAYLEAIERDAFNELPSAVSIKGFIQLFAREVGVDPQYAVALFRRDYTQTSSGRIVPQSYIAPLNMRKRRLSDRVRLALPFLIVAFVAVLFTLFQWRQMRALPNLVLSSPQEGQELQSPVVVRGQTATDVVVLINSDPVGVDQDGNFSAQLALTPGEHTVVVEVKTRDGRSRLVQRSVRVIE